MFSDTLDSSWHERSRRGVTTLTSLGIQAAVVAVLLVLPLLRPQGSPSLRQLSTPVSLAPIRDFVGERARGSREAAVPSNGPIILLPSRPRLPCGEPRSDDNPPQMPGSGAYIRPAVGAGGTGVLNGLGTGVGPVMPTTPAIVTRPVQLSHMSEGDLVRKIVPTYPPLARRARIQGTVVLQAMISKEGAIENLRLVSGHPLLAPAAIEAVSHWRYRPYILNNQPVEVETQITVNFSLAGN